MSPLPYNVRPEYPATIPSLGKKIRYVPFSLKEEKILILAAESGDSDEILNSVLTTIKNCIISPDNIEVRDLAIFDIEYLFLRLRAKSVGEKIKIRVTDPNDELYSVDHEIDIDSINVEKQPGHKDIIDINDTLSVKFKYPGIEFFTETIDMSNVVSGVKVLSKCLFQIINGEEVINRADMTTDEIDEWFDSLTNVQYIKLAEFIDTMPKLRYAHKFKNRRKDSDQFNEEFTIVLEGLADFF